LHFAVELKKELDKVDTCLELKNITDYYWPSLGKCTATVSNSNLIIIVIIIIIIIIIVIYYSNSNK